MINRNDRRIITYKTYISVIQTNTMHTYMESYSEKTKNSNAAQLGQQNTEQCIHLRPRDQGKVEPQHQTTA
jgi:hypothetical protein